MNTTLIISDLHHRIHWVEKYLKEHQYNLVVMLGDYFDDWYDTVEDTEATAKWLLQSIQQPNRVHLIGNHDIWYFWPVGGEIMSSGNTEEKRKVIHEVFKDNRALWGQMKLCYYNQGFLLSHAGVNRNVFEHPMHGISLQGIEATCELALEQLKMCRVHPALKCGRGRWGSQAFGGITWQDWEQEFSPIEGINQIVGHTIRPDFNRPSKYTRKMKKKGKVVSLNYCVDFNNKYVTWITDGKVTFEKVDLEKYGQSKNKYHQTVRWDA